MKLNLETLVGPGFGKEIESPVFDVLAMKEQTRKHPTWLHFGPGNIFRAFIAARQQQLLDKGKATTGIIAVAPNNREIIDAVYQPHDNLSLLVTMLPDQSREQKVVASIAESLAAVPDTPDWQRLCQVIQADSLQIMSFTITEKGYRTKDDQGNWLPAVAADLQRGWQHPQSFPAKVTALLYLRFRNGAMPLTLMSLDNCSGNGQVLRQMVQEIADGWVENDLIPGTFLAYIRDKISYPCSMIDKITPRPSEAVRDMLLSEGFEDMDFVQSSRGGHYAPFVNAEKTEYLVVEDDFANGRPPLEEAGIIFTDAATVDKAERMKVCTCLNPLHTALAVFGCLLSYKSIAAEMKDPALRHLVERTGYDEGLKVVVDPVVLNPKAFLDECIKVRFPNPAIPDTPQRIACDTSQKMPIRYGETIKAYVDNTDLSVKDLKAIPLVIAGWCRYLMGIDDKGDLFTVSADPMLPQLQDVLKNLKLGQPEYPVHTYLKPILSNTNIWQQDLYEVGLGEKIEADFAKMIAGKGAVRKMLEDYRES